MRKLNNLGQNINNFHKTRNLFILFFEILELIDLLFKGISEMMIHVDQERNRRNNNINDNNITNMRLLLPGCKNLIRYI